MDLNKLKRSTSAENIESIENIENIENIDNNDKSENDVKSYAQYYEMLALIRNSLTNYDRYAAKRAFIDNLIPEIKESTTDLERDVILFKNSDGNVIFNSEFEYVGTYIITVKYWSWSWSNIKYGKKNTVLIRKILNYGFNIDYKLFPNIKKRIISSNFFLVCHMQLDNILAHIQEITKNPYIIPLHSKEGTDNYIILANPKIDEIIVKHMKK
jgi:hypothetical protein